MNNLARELTDHIEIKSLESGFSGSRTFDVLDGIYRMVDALNEGDLKRFENVKEYVLTQDSSELGEAVMPNIVSRVDVNYDKDTKTLSQSGFNMNTMMDNGLFDSSRFGVDKQFEHKRRLAEHDNYFKKILPNIDNLLSGKSQFLEVSPAPDPNDIDIDAAHSLGYDPEKGVGVIRLYRRSNTKKDSIEIVQIKIPTSYKSCEALLIDQGLATENDFDQERIRDGSLVLSKAGFIENDITINKLVTKYLSEPKKDDDLYSSLKDDMENFQVMIQPLRQKYMKRLNDYQESKAVEIIDELTRSNIRLFPGVSISEYLDENLKDRLRKDLTIQKLNIWREFVKEIKEDASIVVEMEQNGVRSLVEIDKEGKLRICGQEVDATMEELLNAGARVSRITSIITSDESGELAFGCPTCGAINQRSQLFCNSLIPRCMVCGSLAVGCEDGEENPLCMKYDVERYKALYS